MKKFREYLNKQIILDFLLATQFFSLFLIKFFLRLSGANLLASNQVGKVVPSTFLTLPRGSAFSASPYFINSFVFNKKFYSIFSNSFYALDSKTYSFCHTNATLRIILFQKSFSFSKKYFSKFTNSKI